MLEERSEWLACSCIPEPGGVFAAPRQDGLAIGAEGHGIDTALMMERLANRFARSRLPQLGGSVKGSRQD